MARKREKPYFSHQVSSSLPKKLRRMPSSSKPETQLGEEVKNSTRQSSAMVVVTGLSNGCSVLKLKSRFEMYGCISRLRIDRGIGYITFRSKDSAEAAITASLDPSFEVTIDSHKVCVSWANDPLPQLGEGVELLSNKERLSSKLLRPEIPLSRHGRGNKFGSGTVSPQNGVDLSFKGRDIIAYDDLF